MESQAFKKEKVQSYFLDTSAGSKGKMYEPIYPLTYRAERLNHCLWTYSDIHRLLNKQALLILSSQWPLCIKKIKGKR